MLKDLGHDVVQIDVHLHHAFDSFLVPVQHLGELLGLRFDVES